MPQRPEAPTLAIIESGSDGETCFLEGDDAPFGAPREKAGWEEGGELKLGEEGGTYYPGRREPTYQIMQWREMARVFNGQLRDSMWAEAGHGKRIRDQLVRIASRGRMVRVSWEGEGFNGILHRAKFPREGIGDWTYELEFLVASVVGSEPSDSSQALDVRLSESISDAEAQIRSDLATRRAVLDAYAVTSTVRDALRAGWEAAETALLGVRDAAAGLEAATVSKGRQALTLAQRVDARCADAQNAVQNLSDTLGPYTDPTTVFVSPTAVEALTWGRDAFDTLTVLDALREQLRAMRAEAAARVQPPGNLYTVEAGESLEDIAAKRLGARSRAGDLGVSPRDLRAGAVIPLPRV